MTHRRKKTKWDPDAVVANSGRLRQTIAGAIIESWMGAIAAAAMLRMFNPRAQSSTKQDIQALRRIGRNWRAKWKKAHQGERECARRRRQIAAGILTEANGLVRE
jgi:hypothetical protein